MQVEEIVRAGDLQALCLVMKTDVVCTTTGHLARVLEIGSANLRGDEGRYPDIDLISNAAGYFRKDGTPYR